MYLGTPGFKNHVDAINILIVTRSNGVKWGQRKSNWSIFLMCFKNQVRSTIYSVKNILTDSGRLTRGPWLKISIDPKNKLVPWGQSRSIFAKIGQI